MSSQQKQQVLDSSSETAHGFKEDGGHQEKRSQPLQHLRDGSHTGVGQAEAGDHDVPDPSPNLVAWDGPNDPENPLNWSSAKRWTTVAVVSYMTFLAYVKIFFSTTRHYRDEWIYNLGG